jgi:hypothetical protein
VRARTCLRRLHPRARDALGYLPSHPRGCPGEADAPAGAQANSSLDAANSRLQDHTQPNASVSPGHSTIDFRLAASLAVLESAVSWSVIAGAGPARNGSTRRIGPLMVAFDVGEDRREAFVEHLASDAAEQTRHDLPTDPREPGV